MELLISALVFGFATAATVFIVLKLFSKRIENNVTNKIGESLSSVSHEALERNTDQFLKLADERLARQTQVNLHELTGKKELIDSTLQQMKAEMNSVRELIASFEKDREQKFGELRQGLQTQSEETLRLQEVTANLNKVLSGARQRGQWGERVAEDILHLVGMVEGINYRKQKELGETRDRPDFTFLLPDNSIINMDVKFPLDNFRQYIEATDETTRGNFKKQFLRDARSSIKSVTGRDYIDPAQNTLDFVIVFIPHEQGYAFLMENDPTFMDDAIRSKVIVCSPWSLYALLAVVRQSIDNFNLERSANKILTLMNSFYKQWESFLAAMDKVGKGINGLQRDYETLVTTRRNQLEKPLQKIEQLTCQRELTPGEPEEE
ncbi:MAG: DNA recombination protein RmuC [Candidatus Zixiibacteriota bacterium]|nr:MAG: DNA recombination protein RmuC [candidate division Zixibacteria bacterium]